MKKTRRRGKRRRRAVFTGDSVLGFRFDSSIKAENWRIVEELVLISTLGK